VVIPATSTFMYGCVCSMTLITVSNAPQITGAGQPPSEVPEAARRVSRLGGRGCPGTSWRAWTARHERNYMRRWFHRPTQRAVW